MSHKNKVDTATRPQIVTHGTYTTDAFLMYLIQDTTKLPTSDILGFFVDLSKEIAEEGIHYMYEKGTSSMRKEIIDYFPGTSIPFCLIITGDKCKYGMKDVPIESRVGQYDVNFSFPSMGVRVDQTELANMVMEKAILGGCDMPPFEKPDAKYPNMYKALMKEVQSRRMV